MRGGVHALFKRGQLLYLFAIRIYLLPGFTCCPYLFAVLGYCCLYLFAVRVYLRSAYLDCGLRKHHRRMLLRALFRQCTGYVCIVQGIKRRLVLGNSNGVAFLREWLLDFGFRTPAGRYSDRKGIFSWRGGRRWSTVG